MPGVKVYVYKGCDSCRKALKWLDAQGLEYEALPIRETPPSPEELRAMLRYYGGELRRLFNTSGQDYRAMNLKEKLPKMSEEEAFELLYSNGNLVKRPFLLASGVGLVGFKEAEWESALL